MLKTFKRDEWKEDPAEEAKRSAVLRGNATEPEVRALFPYRAVTKRRLPVYGIPEGSVLSYVRTKHELALYAIEGVIGIHGDAWDRTPRRIVLSSDEVQLIEA